jgi:hypothetical protein
MSKPKFLSAVKSTFGFCGVIYGWDSECKRASERASEIREL